jgi:hypothetical protein
MAHKHRYRSTPLGSGCVPVTRTLGLNQTNTFTFNRYAVKPGRQQGPHNEKPNEGEMVAQKKVSGVTYQIQPHGFSRDAFPET